MPVVPARAFTQGPALLGQSTTNEILADGLIKLPMRILRMIKLTIHDAIAASIPKASFERDRDTIVRCLTTRWKPRYGGVEIEFPVTYGSPAPDWKRANH
jgi:DNA polymerase-1